MGRAGSGRIGVDVMVFEKHGVLGARPHSFWMASYLRYGEVSDDVETSPL